MGKRLKDLFMSKEQTIYLVFLFFNCIIYGAFSATFAYYEIGLGARFYSILMILGCVVGVIHCYVATDMNKKIWVFRHYKAIDIGESIFYTITQIGFLCFYFWKGMDPTINEKPVLQLFFFYSIFYRIISSILSIVIPSIGNVFEQSLYKNQIDYQNHSNAEGLMASFGAAFGALASFLVGDFFKNRPYLIFTLIVFDWVGLWTRWQFYFKPSNYEIIKRNFARDCAEKKRRNVDGQKLQKS